MIQQPQRDNVDGPAKVESLSLSRLDRFHTTRTCGLHSPCQVTQSIDQAAPQTDTEWEFTRWLVSDLTIADLIYYLILVSPPSPPFLRVLIRGGRIFR